jgi:hypothetical protein
MQGLLRRWKSVFKRFSYDLRYAELQRHVCGQVLSRLTALTRGFLQRSPHVRIKKIGKPKDLRGSIVSGSMRYQAMPRLIIIKPQQATNKVSTINLHKY